MSFLFTKRALEAASAFKLLSFRFLLAFLVMSLLIALRIIKVDYKNKPVKDLLIASLAQPVIYFIFETYSIKFTSSSYAGLFIALIPISVSLMGIYFLKEMPNKMQWFFILLSVGVVFIMLNGLTSSQGRSLILGTLFLFAAIAAASLFSIYSRKISTETDFTSMELTYFMMGMGALVFNSIALILDIVNNNMGNFFSPLFNRNFVVSVVYLGLLSSVVAYYLMNYTLSRLPASRSSVFANLSTIVSIAAGVVILHEKFYLYHLIGSAMILAGIIGTNYFDVRTRNLSSQIK
jgi:drug/metabolite transporter (DMT)-like permease